MYIAVHLGNREDGVQVEVCCFAPVRKVLSIQGKHVKKNTEASL